MFLRLFFASFLWSPTRSKKKKRSHANFRFAWLLVLLKMLFLHFRYSVYSLVEVSVKCPRVVESIARKFYFIIEQGAVYSSVHYHSTIFKNFALGFLSVCGCYLKHTFEDVLRPYSVNFLFHNLKIQPLIICIPLALHWTVCGV